MPNLRGFVAELDATHRSDVNDDLLVFMEGLNDDEGYNIPQETLMEKGQLKRR